jgi:hypothetical protein
MGLKNDVDPWERIRQLEAEVAEMKAELQAAHNALDGAGADSEHGIREITEGPQTVNMQLDARIIRYLLEHACPLGKVRR